MKRMFIATVQNGGILNRITAMLNKRQLHVESFSVGPSEKAGVSKLTFVVEESDRDATEQLVKQLRKQIDVLHVADITDKEVVARELALVKVGAKGQFHAEVQSMITPFRASVIDVSHASLTVQVTGSPEKVDALVTLLKPYGIIELTRTGMTASLRGDEPEVKALHTDVM